MLSRVQLCDPMDCSAPGFPVLHPKVDCCVEAVRRGVKHAIIMDGRIEHSILIELLTDEGIGTMFR